MLLVSILLIFCFKYLIFLTGNDYDIYDMLEGDDYQNRIISRQRQTHQHKYPPYYFTHKYFGAKVIEEVDDSDESFESQTNNYSEKSQLAAFLLSFFLGGFGVGRFYVGLYFSAIFKCFLGAMIYCIACCFPLMDEIRGGSGGEEYTNEHHRSVSAFMKFCCGCICPILWIVWIVWIITDWVLFGINDIPDGYGRTLYPW